MPSPLARVTRLAALAALALSVPPPASGLDFEPRSYFGGPRFWVGNLNGATAIGAQVERGFTSPGEYGSGFLSGGVGVDWYSWSHDYPTGSYDYSVIPMQVFGNYHFVIPNVRKFDPYAGIAFVYSIVNASWDGAGSSSVDASGSYFDVAGHAGTRYFITPTFAAQAQIGFGYGTLGLGAAWMF